EDERPVEQPARRPGDHNHGEYAPPPPRAETERSPELRPLDQQPQSLNREVERRQPIPSAGRNGDDEVVNDAAEEESRRDGRSRAEPTGQRAKKEPVRQIAERRVPSPAPEIAHVRGQNRPDHQRLRIHTRGTPRAAQEMERSEVQEEN